MIIPICHWLSTSSIKRVDGPSNIGGLFHLYLENSTAWFTTQSISDKSHILKHYTKGGDKMVQVLDYQATEPLSIFNPANAFTIPQAPFKVILASIQIKIPGTASRNNNVELVATVGVEGITNISQIVFRIFRNGKEIFNTQDGVESAGSEINYTFTFQAIDSNLIAGTNFYQLTVENITPNTQANVVGPLSFSGLAIKRTN